MYVAKLSIYMCMRIVSSPTSGVVHSITLVGGNIKGGCVRCSITVAQSQETMNLQANCLGKPKGGEEVGRLCVVMKSCSPFQE